MLKVEGLKVHGLEPVSFEVAGGECVAIQGPSGSGKTLLLRAIADLDPVEGEVYLNGEERGSMPGPAWRRRVRYLAAEPGWWTDTPRGSLGEGNSVATLAASLGLKAVQLDQSLAELSTGERQRLALVRAVLDKPDVLLLDEPTGALDARSIAMAEKLIKAQLGKQRSTVFVSHDPSQVDRMAGRVFVIRGGRLKARRR